MGVLKASDADKEHFRPVLSDRNEVIIKPMFVNLGRSEGAKGFQAPTQKLEN